MKSCLHISSISAGEKLCALLYATGLCLLYVNRYLGLNITICPIKLLWHIPCPACGTTRAILLLIDGHPFEALVMNPNIVLTVPLLAFIPIAFCVQHFYRQDFYSKLNLVLHHRMVISFFIVFEAFVWFYNIIRNI